MAFYDVVLIGGGLAGSLLALELKKNDVKVLVIDSGGPGVASRSAAGLTNPITGKRLVKSWLIDQLLPKAKETYLQLEQQLGVSFYHPTEIARVIPNDDIFEQWQPNFQQGIVEGYIEPTIYNLQTHGLKPMRYFRIKHAFWINTSILLNHVHEQLNRQHSLRLGAVNFHTINPQPNQVVVEHNGKQIIAKKLIFCEGNHILNNPFFNHLKFRLNKGELIDIEAPDLQIPFVLKKNIFIIPLTKTTYRVGATYNWDDVTPQNTAQGLSYLETKLQEVGVQHYKILSKRVGIRPASFDRRPFIGAHRSHPNLLVFNGFGAKGASLIPYFAEQFAQVIVGKSQHLNPETSCLR